MTRPLDCFVVRIRHLGLQNDECCIFLQDFIHAELSMISVVCKKTKYSTPVWYVKTLFASLVCECLLVYICCSFINDAIVYIYSACTCTAGKCLLYVWTLHVKILLGVQNTEANKRRYKLVICWLHLCALWSLSWHNTWTIF